MRLVKLVINFILLMESVRGNSIMENPPDLSSISSETICPANDFLFLQQCSIDEFFDLKTSADQQIDCMISQNLVEPESKAQSDKIMEYEENFPNLPSRYIVHNGKNRTLFHHALALGRPLLGLYLAKSIIQAERKIEDALPEVEDKLPLEYVFTTDEGRARASKHLLSLTRFMLQHTKKYRQEKNFPRPYTIMEAAILTGMYPRILELIAVEKGTFSVNFHQNYTCSPLSMLMLSNFAPKYIDVVVRTFIERGTNINEAAPCRYFSEIYLIFFLL